MAEMYEGPLDSLEPDQGSYPVRDLIGWQRDRSLELRPRFQRGSVWSRRDKSFLIDSIIRGFPIPLIVLQHETRSSPTDVIRRVVDGQQRLRTIISFVEPSLLDRNESDDWTYYPADSVRRGQGLKFEDLTPAIQNRILSTKLSVASIQAGATMAQVLEIYDRLNSTGSRLTNQELRYAKRDGRFSDLSYRLARHHQERWLDWRVFKESDVARMKEVEFTSELLLLLMGGISKTGKKEIDDAYASYKEEVPGEEGLMTRFDGIMEALDDALATPASPDPLRAFRSRGWLYALFAWQDSQQRLKPGVLGQALEQVATKLASDRRTNADLVRAISGSASDKKSREDRLEYFSKEMSSALS